MPVCTDNYEHEINNGKNLRTIKCTYCDSVILAPDSACFVKIESELPLMQQNKTNAIILEKELISSYWSVPDMYTFQNVGFSNTVGSTKYLTCADCEAGPIGYHDLGNGRSYVALARVRHC
ncbi:hypothetical protein HHI36_002903 [Cryptolaemus montrouzieri]|uniref:Uncharacterized protein n=1 Tax=Cryptolaemus montrouzieri TaxID=559131 RepID=A0ABD2PCG8_9CUCU